MPLLTLKQAADELGLKSEQSIRNLARRGEFRILQVRIEGTRGSPRVDSRELEEYVRRLKSASESGTPSGPAPGPVRRPTTRPKSPNRTRQPRGRAPLMHFE